MSATTNKPLKPITPAQIRALHAIARRPGMSHEQLRDSAGVEILKHLSVTQAAELIDLMQTASHRKAWRPSDPQRTTRGALRNATDRQRNYIQSLFDQLGWDAGKASDWLRQRHGIRDLARGRLPDQDDQRGDHPA